MAWVEGEEHPRCSVEAGAAATQAPLMATNNFHWWGKERVGNDARSPA